MSEDRIMDFLDGRLGGADEEELLHSLAVSPERRQLLHNHLRLRELTAQVSSKDRFGVPEHVSAQLFQKLAALGFVAAPSTGAILTHAKDYVHHEPTATSATTSRPRLSGMAPLAAASLLSFIIGVTAVYVFGAKLGVSPFGSETMARQTAFVHHQSIVTTTSFSLAPQSTLLASVLPTVRSLQSVSGNVEPAAVPMHSVAQQTTSNAPATPVVAEIPNVAIVAPKQDIAMPSYTAPATVMILTPEADADPFLGYPIHNARGTISFREGGGRASALPFTTNASASRQLTTLSELKFTWQLGAVLTARASLGQLVTHESEANYPVLVGPKEWMITASPQTKAIAVAGLELGASLDAFGIPLELSAGALEDGALHTYWRGGAFAHYEPFPSLTMLIGLEALWYRHDVSESLQNAARTYKDYRPTVQVGGVETDGFIGPSIEVGWHF